jgi:hypothetical protein
MAQEGRGFCKNNEIRIPKENQQGNISLDKVRGSKVIIKSLTISNGFNWEPIKNKEYTISDIAFRISTDGKCFTIVKIKEIPDRTFTLKDIEFKLD